LRTWRPVEDRRLRVFGDAGTAVTYPQQHVAATPRGADVDQVARRGVRHGVRDELDQRLREPLPIGDGDDAGDLAHGPASRSERLRLGHHLDR